MQDRADLLLTNVSLPGGRRADITITDGVVMHAGAPCIADRNID
jgi:dihydroorotase